MKDGRCVRCGKKSKAQLCSACSGPTPSTPFEEAAARVRASSYLDLTFPKRKRKKHRLVKRAELLYQDQLELLILLLKGGAAVVTVHGESYAVRRTGAGHSVRSLAHGAAEYAVVDDRCTCPDSKFRDRICKHVEALSCLR